jgi:hypothetical protein
MLRRIPLVLGALTLVAACGVSSATPTSSTVPELALSGLPAPVANGNGVAAGPGRTTTTFAPEQQVAASVSGNRVMLIGDSVMASTSRRYTNDMCNALVPLGWQVEVDAETGRFIPFGNKVLDKRLDAGWDAAVILLGNNYAENQEDYRRGLETMVMRLSPRPIVLLTVTEFKPSRAQVNEVIRTLAQKYDNIRVVDWATTTADDPSLTGGDHLHLTNSGRAALAENVALALGQAPVTPGECLKTSFTDDSSGPVTGTSLPYRPVHTTTTTTVGGGSGGSGGTPSTSPPITDPVVTGTSPVVTSPAVTTTIPKLVTTTVPKPATTTTAPKSTTT